MKKLLAVLLALLMMALPVLGSCEEPVILDPANGIVFAQRIDDPVIEFEGQKIDLTGLNISYAIGGGKNGGMLTLRVGAAGKEVAGILIELDKEGIYFTADGMSDVYSVKYADLLNLIAPDAAEELKAIGELINSFTGLFTEENLADFAERLTNAFEEISGVIANGATQETGDTEVNGNTYTGSKTVFNYGGEEIKSMLVSLVKAYVENPGFAVYVKALQKLALGAEEFDISNMLNSVEIPVAVSGNVFTSENGDAWQTLCDVTVEEQTLHICLYYTMDESGIAFGFTMQPKGEEMLAITGTISDSLTAVCTFDDEKQFDLTSGMTETGFAASLNTADQTLELTTGNENIFTLTRKTFTEDDFTYATLEETGMVSLNMTMDESDIKFVLTASEQEVGEAAEVYTITADLAMLDNGFRVAVDANDNGDIANFIMTLTASETEVQVKAEANENLENIFLYDYTVLMDGDSVQVKVNESLLGGEVTENTTWDAVKNGTLISGPVSIEIGGVSSEKASVKMNEAVSISEMGELQLAGKANAKDLIQILSAGEDSAQFQGFVTGWYSLAMNALADLQQAFPAVAEMFTTAQ